MEIASWRVLGRIISSLARLAMSGPAAEGIRMAIFIGVVAALIGGLLGTTISPNVAAPFDGYALLMAANGAIVVLILYRCVALRFEDAIPS